MWAETKPWSGDDPASTLDLKTITSSTMGTWNGETAWYLDDDYLIVEGYESYKSVANQTWITHASVGSSNSTWEASAPFKGSSYYSTAAYATIKSGRYLLYKVTNMKSLKVYGKNNKTTIYLDIFIYTKSGDDYTKVEEIKYTTDNNVHVWENSEELDPAETYYVYITGVGNSNSQVYEVAFERNVTKHTLSSAVSPVSSGTVTLGATSVGEGSSTTITATPNTGYSFVNWTVTGTGATVADATAASTTFTMGTADATVTANFTAVTYFTVTYDYNDGETANEVVNVPFADAATYTLKAVPSRTDYNFLGWKIGETTYAAGAAYEPTANVTAQAQWEFNGTLTTYNKSTKSDLATGAKYVMASSYTNGSVTTWKYATAMGANSYLHSDVVGEHGTLNTDNAIFYNETPEIITLNETSDGWTMTTENGKIGLTGDKKLGYDNGDTTWDLGGTDELPTFSATTGSKTEIMKFNWNGGDSRFNAYESGQQDVYFYRLDDGKNIYTLTLDYNYGEVADATHRVLEGATYTLTTPTRAGYRFTGWNTAENGTGTNYAAGSYTMPAAATTLYAQWSNTATITLNAACTDGALVYGTYSNSQAFVVSDDIEVSEVGVVDGKLVVDSYNSGDVVPANTGVMVAALAGGNYDVTLSAEAGTSVLGSDNLLKASGDAGITAANMTVADTKFYRLTMHDGTKIGFWWGAESGAAFNLAANKAYLAVPESELAPAPSFFWFNENTPTGIKAIDNGQLTIENSEVYNLAGQRVANPTKGLYVVNGRKVVLK